MSPTAKRIVKYGCGALGGIIGIVAVSVVRDCLAGDIPNQDTSAAEQVIERTIATPSTAKYISARTVASSGENRIVLVTFDAQNRFSAIIRMTSCVSFHYKGDRIEWKPINAMTDCEDPPDPTLLKTIENADGW